MLLHFGILLRDDDLYIEIMDSEERYDKDVSLPQPKFQLYRHILLNRFVDRLIIFILAHLYCVGSQFSSIRKYSYAYRNHH